MAVDRTHVELLLGGAAGGTEEVLVSGEVVLLTAGEPVKVARRRSTAPSDYHGRLSP